MRKERINSIQLVLGAIDENGPMRIETISAETGLSVFGTRVTLTYCEQEGLIQIEHREMDGRRRMVYARTVKEFIPPEKTEKQRLKQIKNERHRNPVQARVERQDGITAAWFGRQA